ncbi:MAG: hypothetical protein AAFN10_06575 [Bacteroidota bacterium]
MAFTNYGASAEDILPWQNKFFVEDEAEEITVKFQTIIDSSLEVAEPQNRFILCRITDNKLYQYAQIQLTDSTRYPELKDQVLAILNEELAATETLEDYDKWINKKRQARLGDIGSSFETAISAPSIAFEYQWLRDNYPGHKFLQQSLIFNEGKPFDVLKVKLEDGTVIEVYFDISSFFGKGFK